MINEERKLMLFLLSFSFAVDVIFEGTIMILSYFLFLCMFICQNIVIDLFVSKKFMQGLSGNVSNLREDIGIWRKYLVIAAVIISGVTFIYFTPELAFTPIVFPLYMYASYMFKIKPEGALFATTLFFVAFQTVIYTCVFQ